MYYTLSFITRANLFPVLVLMIVFVLTVIISSKDKKKIKEAKKMNDFLAKYRDEDNTWG